MNGIVETSEAAARQQELLAHPRYSVDEEVVLSLVDESATWEGRMVNLNLAGCCIRTKDRLDANAQTPVEVAFSVQGTAFRLSGVMEWTDGHLADIHFVNMSPRRAADLIEIVGEIEAKLAARTQAADTSTLKPTNPAREGTPKGGQAPETAKDAPGGAQQPAAATIQRERRKQARYAVDDDATIFLVKTGLNLQGRIEDLSLSGCRIRTSEPCRLDIYTRIEVEFRLQGLVFRMSGVIQDVYMHNTVGIRFLDLSARRQEQVAEIIGELEQFQAKQQVLLPAGM